MKKKVAVVKKPVLSISASMFRRLANLLLFSEFFDPAFVKKVYSLFSIIETSGFETDGDTAAYYKIIHTFVWAFIENEIRDRELLVGECVDIPSLKDEIEGILEEIYEVDIDRSMATAVENFVITRLNFTTLSDTVKDYKTLIDKYNNDDFDSFEEIIELFKKMNARFTSKLSPRSASVISIPDINFDKRDELRSNLSKAREILTNSKRIVKLGVKRLNRMLSGGLQPGRVYCVLGITSGWKSCALLNIAIWAVKYNQDIFCNDQSKKPAVIYLTQENDQLETLDRMFSYIKGVDFEKGTYLPDEDLDLLMEGEKLAGSNVAFMCKYRKKGSMTVSDIDALIADVEASGEYEVKLLVQDYIKRITPEISTGDQRVDFGEIANDLSNLAKERKIPIVTANQLNRDSYKIKVGAKDSDCDFGKKLSLSQMSESQLIAENVDSIFAVYKEFSTICNQFFIGFTDLKQRAEKSNKTETNKYFVHPFEDPENGMRLIEDLEMEDEASFESIEDRVSALGYGDVAEENVSQPPAKPIKIRESVQKPQIRRVSIDAEFDNPVDAEDEEPA